ncbi:MAG: D-aminoacyl-tRNA deacylase [Candidatus Cloacimonadales bacterium]
MKLLIQRVKRASVTVEDEIVSQIGPGLLLFLGVGREDDGSEISWLVQKLLGLRIFEDEAGKMNLSLQDRQAELLLVPQFTLYGDCQRGRRPGFSAAAAPAQAQKYFQEFAQAITASYRPAQLGVFGADMQVELINDGPVTFMIERSEAQTLEKTRE